MGENDDTGYWLARIEGKLTESNNRLHRIESSLIYIGFFVIIGVAAFFTLNAPELKAKLASWASAFI